MNYVLAHNLGASGNKTTQFNENGLLVVELTIGCPTNHFNSNWSEQYPDDWWASVCQGTKQTLIEGIPVIMGGGNRAIAGIGAGAVTSGYSFMGIGLSAWVSTVSPSPLFDSMRRNTDRPHIVEGLYLSAGAMVCLCVTSL